MSEEQGKQLATINTGSRGLEIKTLDDLWRFSKFVVTSGWAPKDIDTAEKALVCIQMGMELGLPYMQAIQGIACINGRPSVWGATAKAVAESSGLVADFREWFEGKEGTDDFKAVCEILRKGRTTYARQEFSIRDAKKAGLWQEKERVTRKRKDGGTYEVANDSPWFKYPKRMLQMRARGFAMNDAVPDALKGLILAEEAQDFIDVEASEPVPAPTSLDEVADRFAPEPDPEPEEKPKKGKGKAKPEPEPEPDEDETPWENAPPAEPDVAEDAEKEELREEIQRIVELHSLKNKFQNMTGFEYSKLGEYEVNTLRQLLERMREATA